MTDQGSTLNWLGQWDPAKESFDTYNDRRNRIINLRNAMCGSPFERYSIAIEHGQLKDYGGECLLHAYVLCNDCWRKPPGEVDPRAMVLTGEIMTWLVPQNADLELGARMVEIIQAIIKHETEEH